MKNRRLLFIAITVVYAGALTFFSMQPDAAGSTESALAEFLHNCMHIPAYGILAFLILNCFATPGKREAFVSFIAAFMFGAFNEVIQIFVPSRICSLTDIFLNGMGAAAFLALYYRFRSVSQRKVP